MGRRPGSKNKPKTDKIKSVEDNALSHWNETIQKLNDMKEEGDWANWRTCLVPKPKNRR